MSSFNDYMVMAPQGEHESIMEQLSDYRCHMEDSSEDGIWIQGHCEMFEVIKEKFDYDFTEEFIGTNYDLMVHYSKMNGEWQEELELYWHGSAPEHYKNLSVDEFNDALNHRFDDDYVPV